MNDDKGARASAIINPDGLVIVPELSPEHTMSGTQGLAGGLLGVAQQNIAIQAGVFDMEMAKRNMVKLAEFMEHMKRVAFSGLKSSDFVAYSSISGDSEDDGQPWLTVHAAERVASICGVACGFLNPAMETETGEDSSGPWFIRRARMCFRWGHHYTEAIGESESRDSLFSAGGKLSASQVPRAKIGRKAISRATQTGVCVVLGLRGLTWARLAELMGKDVPKPEDVQRAKFKKGAKGGGLETGKDTDAATKAQFGSVYQTWCESTGKSSAREAFKANAEAFYGFVNHFLNEPPDARRKWDQYKLGEVRTLKAEAEALKTQGGGE